jgi:hypothetical protein
VKSRALRRSYDSRIDTFRCQRSGALLVLDDPTDPFHLRWDHHGPGSTGAMEVTCELFASMRAGLSGLEFETLIWALAGHRRPFPKVDLDPRGWPERRHPPKKVDVASGGPECTVCGKPAHARYCPRCRELVRRGGSGDALRVEALKRAWRAGEDGFACYYTGVVLDEGGPWGVAFDERVPGSTVVAAEWVRRMKRGLSEGEFRAVAREERRHLRTGRPFDRRVARFEYWRRRREPG